MTKPDSMSLGKAMPKEIERCQKLLSVYKTIPTGAFAATMIELDIKNARRAIRDQDLPAMIQAYQALKNCN